MCPILYKTLFFCSVALASFGSSGTVLTNLVEIESRRSDGSASNCTFNVRAPVIVRLEADRDMLLRGNDDAMLILGDANGVAQFRHIRKPSDPDLLPGDVVEISGNFASLHNSTCSAECQHLTRLGKGHPVNAPLLTTREFANGMFDLRLSRIRGLVKDAFQDEIDPRYVFLVLQCDDATIYVACRDYLPVHHSITAHIGTTIVVKGMPCRQNSITRLHLGRYFYVWDSRQIETIDATDPFSAADLQDVLRLSPQEISRLGYHRAEGSVLATLHDRSFLMRTSTGLIVKVLSDSDRPPQPGQPVVASGFPECNLYHLNLVHAKWKPVASGKQPPTKPLDVASESLAFVTRGQRVINSRLHGRLVRIHGKVLTLPNGDDRSDGLMQLECGSQIVSANIGALKGMPERLQRNCLVEITGICILDFETWRPNSAFPHIRGFLIVPRSATDIRIIATPSWWTLSRLLIVLAILLPIALASLVLNFILKRLVERRSRALLKEQSAKLAETLRVGERTRLAAELHDSVAQDLTGIAMQIETAADLATGASDKLRNILDIAARSLQNCREELRDCLWDLRSQALDERILGDAILKAIKPKLDGVELSLRFNVPRAVVSDATAHATLQIIRELTINAVRHGKATHLRICGAIERQHLMFSVADNGVGFDLEHTPGVSQGHFGLAGIRERVRKLGGKIIFDSLPGSGTKVSVTL